MDYFYDQQIRRYILQVTRVFGGFIVKTGTGGKDKTVQNRQVPVRYGETSRMVNHIIRLNSENSILYTPFMSTHITSVTMAPDRRQNPSLVTTHQIDEREWDGTNKEYTKNIGNRFTVKRHMPVPYNITFQLDIWASNTHEKLQLLEQIWMLFNPAIDLQTSDSPLDWTAITYMEMQDDIAWSSRTVPYGTDETIEVSSMKFLVPAWINPPAELTQRKVIDTIVNNIFALSELPDDCDVSFEDDGDLLTQNIITPNNHISISNNEITLLGIGGIATDDLGEPFSWSELLLPFGEVTEGESTINVKQKFGDPVGITGTFTFDPARVNVVFWTPDPADLFVDTLNPVDAIIDPSKNFPGDGTLAAATIGQRYLIADNIPGQTIGWGLINNAEVNDIIQFDGTDWIVDFDSSEEANVQIMTSLAANRQFRWNGSNEWAPTVDREYLPGTWRAQL